MSHIKQITSQITIFQKNINNSYKSIPFKIIQNDIGESKYFPAASKEWKNSIYSYNKNFIKNLPVYDLTIYKIIKSYFNMHISSKIFGSKYLSSKRRRKSLNKIFIGKPEIKHISSKVIITLYTYNREKYSLDKKINFLKQKRLLRNGVWKKRLWKKRSSYLKKLYSVLLKKNFLNVSPFVIYNQIIKFRLYRKLKLLRKYKLRLNLNNYKFKDILLNNLSKLLSKYYNNKKIEFNIIKLKSIAYHADIFTEILKMKIRKRNININKNIKYVVGKARLPKINTTERKVLAKSVDFNLLENIYKNSQLNLLIKEKNLNDILENTYNNFSFQLNNLFKNYCTIKDIVFNTLQYKIIRGIRLEIKGRLTKRYRADRAIRKIKWKGGLRNIDSYKGKVSSVKFRGYTNSNVEYSIVTSKRRIGSFAVRGWISGK
jgi:hypothetical protein